MKQKELIRQLKLINAQGAEENISPALILALENYKPLIPVMVYRALTFIDHEDFTAKTGLKEVPQLGTWLKLNLGQHWTTSYSTAEEFSEYAGRDISFIVQTVLDPADIIVEMSRLPKEILDHIEWNSEEEVISLAKPIECIVLQVVKS